MWYVNTKWCPEPRNIAFNWREVITARWSCSVTLIPLALSHSLLRFSNGQHFVQKPGNPVRKSCISFPSSAHLSVSLAALSAWWCHVTRLAARGRSRDHGIARAGQGPLQKNPDKGWGCRVSAEFKLAFLLPNLALQCFIFCRPLTRYLASSSLKE